MPWPHRLTDVNSPICLEIYDSNLKLNQSASAVVAPESCWAQLTLAAESLSLSAVEKGRPEAPVDRNLSWVDGPSSRLRANCCSSPASWKLYAATCCCLWPSLSSTCSRWGPCRASAWMCSRPNQNSPADRETTSQCELVTHTRTPAYTHTHTHRSGRRSRSCSSPTAGRSPGSRRSVSG